MNLTNLQSVLAPILTPAAPALILMNHSYTSLINDNVLQPLAVFGAAASGAGLEFSGALAFAMGLIAIKRRNWAAASLSGIGVIGYAGLMLMGVGTGADWMSFAPFVGGSLVAFMAVAVKSELDFSQAQEKKLADEKAEAQRLKIAELDAERRALNAQARVSKLSNEQMNASSVSSGQSGQAEQVRGPNPELLGRVRGFMESNPGCSARAIATALEISPTTASNYKKFVEGNHAA